LATLADGNDETRLFRVGRRGEFLEARIASCDDSNYRWSPLAFVTAITRSRIAFYKAPATATLEE
jgi:hypothetical protein